MIAWSFAKLRYRRENMFELIAVQVQGMMSQL